MGGLLRPEVLADLQRFENAGGHPDFKCGVKSIPLI